MPQNIDVRYAAKQETNVYKSSSGRKIVNKVLLGPWLGVERRDSGRLKVRTAGKDGWVRESDTRGDSGLKLFFVDVGQGDGILVETPDKRFLVDGGPNSNLLRYLAGWQYRYLFAAGKQVRFDAAFVSHFDADHYDGLTRIIADPRFSFGTVYHNGIARFQRKQNDRPAEYNRDLGRTTTVGSKEVLRTTFSTLDQLKQLHARGGLQSTFRRFAEAVFAAHGEGRLAALRRLTVRDGRVPGFTDPSGLVIDVLGPVPTRANGAVAFEWFHNSSHTRNGHSVVLRFTYGDDKHKFLLGGDLNSAAEDHLLEHYRGREAEFRVDVAKGCHHGASDFTTAFMKALNAQVTIISSGDNESYSHPRADALGTAGRYGGVARPLVFSTELARAVRGGGDVLYGMIQVRSDGKTLIAAQMKEVHTGADIWDSYLVPFKSRRP